MSARMEIKHGSRLRPEIYNRVPLHDLQNDDLILNQGGQGRWLAGFVPKPRQFLAGNCEDVEALPEALAENEQLDSRRIAQRRGFLMDKAVPHEGLQMAIDSRLRRGELACELRNAD